MKHFVIVGNHDHAWLIKPEHYPHICGIYFNKPINSSLRRDLLSVYPFAIFTPDDIFNNKNIDITHYQYRDNLFYDKFYEFVLQDPRTILLSERLGLTSCMSHYLRISISCFLVILIFQKCEADVLLSSSYPHSFQSWIILKFFQFTKKTILTLERTPLLSRCWIAEGFNQESIFSLPMYKGDRLNRNTDSQLSQHTKDFVATQTRRNVTSCDQVDNSRLNLDLLPQARSGKYFSLTLELKNLLSSKLTKFPLRIYQSLVKYRCYGLYRDNELSGFNSSCRYITFFLHYQPERTSLPEGNYYAQQFHAINYIASSIPKDTILLVKEHPTTWWRILDLRSRNLDFYRRVSRIPNVQFVPMSTHTFELIDHSEIVATITGKVGFQALLRSVPVLYFGLAPYRMHPYAFDGSKSTSLSSLIDDLFSNSHISSQSFAKANQEFLEWIESNSTSIEFPAQIATYKERLCIFSALYDNYFASL